MAVKKEELNTRDQPIAFGQESGKRGDFEKSLTRRKHASTRCSQSEHDVKSSGDEEGAGVKKA